VEAIVVEDLIKRYKDGTLAVDNISFSVKKGDFFALLGPNGAGKSTTISIISSLVNKTKGKVIVLGKDLDTQKSQVKELIGLVPQEFNFNIFEKTQDILLNQAGYYGIQRLIALKRSEVLLKRLGLWEKRNTQSKNLSGGMKRKLMIVRALMHKPQILILDEPTAGVDVETRREMWDYFKELNRKGTTIILTTHYLEEAEQLCKNITIINKGKIAKDTNMKDLLATLDMESFLLDVKGPIQQALSFKEYEVKQIDKNTLEVLVPKEKDLNSFFAFIDTKKIKVLSMRTKSNRLEELFIQLIEK
jgi:ABC-2 type transport system ATP-binding protein